MPFSSQSPGERGLGGIHHGDILTAMLLALWMAHMQAARARLCQHMSTNARSSLIDPYCKTTCQCINYLYLKDVTKYKERQK